LAVAARGDLVQTVVASGHVEAPHRVSIGTQIVGTVRQVPVAEGQAVKAGQTLVVLDSAELAAAAQQADVAVQQAQARLRQIAELQAPVAQQQLRQAQVNADNARRQWRRQQDLYRQGFIGEAALDDARKAVDLADAQLHAAHKQLDTLRPSGSDHALAAAELAQAQASAKAARARLGYATIAAPSDGVLISRDVEPGDVVQPGKALMVLSPAGETQLVVQIDEKNLGLLALGQSAQASADAYPSRRFGAELVYINPGVDAQSGSVEVKLRVPSPPAYLLQDMTVSVDIEVARRQQAVLLPADAVHDDAAHGAWVLRVDEGRAHRQAVQLGVRSGGVVEVLQGVQPGDRLVPAGEARVRDGSRVREAARG
jgi:HlyD family secretion protein